MKRVPTILRLALVAAAASSVPACTFAAYLREHDHPLTAGRSPRSTTATLIGSSPTWAEDQLVT